VRTQYRKKEVEVEDDHVPQGCLPPKCEAFMHGRMQQLLLTCGFNRLPESYLEAAKREESRHGLDVHVPPYDEVPCHVRLLVSLSSSTYPPFF
jgi:hypothetical protein